jgi:hypothetical protein
LGGLQPASHATDRVAALRSAGRVCRLRGFVNAFVTPCGEDFFFFDFSELEEKLA